jgi:hypothetical protein
MNKRLQDLVACGLIPILLEFLGPVSSCTRFALLNKACYEAVCKYYIKYHLGTVEQGVLEDLPGDMLLQLWDSARIFPHSLNLANLSPQARHMMTLTNNTHFLHMPQFSNDLLYDDGYIFTCWFGTREHPEKGIYHALMEKQQSHPEWYLWKDVLLTDCLYWNSSRVYGNFIVLFDRPDGTILVSDNFKQVYLVVGITHAIGSLHHIQLHGTFHYTRLPSYHPPKMHGPYIGVKVRISLLPWMNMIVYNGVSSPYATTNAKDKTKALHAYRHALIRGTLITQLPYQEPSGEHEVMKEEDIRVYAHATRAEMPSKVHKLSQIRTSSVLPEVQFRRLSECESVVPKHIVTLLDTDTGSCYGTFHSQEVVPTCEEYVDYLLTFSMGKKLKPLKVSIDAYEVYDILKALLTKIGIKVYYDPPYSPEHDTFLELHNPIALSQPFRPSCEYCQLTNAMLAEVHEQERAKEELGEFKVPSEHSVDTPAHHHTSSHRYGHDHKPHSADFNNEATHQVANTLHRVHFHEKDTTGKTEDEAEWEIEKGQEEEENVTGKMKHPPSSIKPIPTLSRCSRCQKVFYCCREHQTTDWTKHRKICNQVTH